MNEVERYLKRVTKGLPRARGGEIRAELESHIFERMQALRLEGVSEDAARVQMLKELGSPDKANQALRRVHYVHPALNIVVATGVLAVAWMGWQWRMISAFPLTGLPSSFTDPLYPPRVVSSGDFEGQMNKLLSFSEAAAIFRGTRVQITGNDEHARLVFSDHASLNLGPVVRRKIDCMELPKRYGFYVAPPAFVDFNELMLLVLRSKWPVSMDVSNEAVKISVDGQSLNMPPELARMNTSPFLELWNQQVSALLKQPIRDSGFLDWKPLFRTKGRHFPLTVYGLVPREIYALAIKRVDTQASIPFKENYVSSSMTHADASGTSSFFNLNFSGKAVIENFRFVDSIKAWEKAPKNTAILLKLDPTFKSPPKVVPRTGVLTAK